MESYIERFRLLADLLAERRIHAEVLGRGNGSFLYARQRPRTLEASEIGTGSDEGKVRVEFRIRGLGAPREEIYPDYAPAIEAMLKWLT